MKRDIGKMSRIEYDLAIVGGGIHGASAAWDAALRGLSVALVEQGDFGQATSANSQQIVHGGLRYLQSLDIPRLRESAGERRTLLRIAPHLVQPLPCLMPTYGHGWRSRWAMSAAFLINDLLTFDRNQVIDDPARRIPRCTIVSPAECLRLAPGIREEGLTGGALWHDGQIWSAERLTLSFVLSAAESGSDVANYVKASGVLREGRRVTGITAQDVLTGETFSIRARVVINAGGPWVYRILEPLAGEREAPTQTFIKGIALVTRRLPNQVALAVESRAPQSRDGLLFITPWRDRSLVGCIYSVVEGHPEDSQASAQDVAQLLQEINLAYSPARLVPEDVLMVRSGLLPARPAMGGKSAAIEPHSRVIDHKQVNGLDGLISLIGVKYTTARRTAEKAVDLAIAKLARPAAPSRSKQIAVYGGRIDRFQHLLEGVSRARPFGLSEPVVKHLVHGYGAAYTDVLDWVKADSTLAEPIEGSSEVIKAEVVNGIRREMAQTLCDVVFRRTGLGALGHPGEAALKACASIVAKECGWGAERVSKELAQVESCFARRERAEMVVA